MRRILLVDDHLSTCTPLTKLLRSRGYEAMFALSGREGILAMERFTPDVVLLDVMMPRMDGFETLGLIRGRPEFAQVAVLMYTAMSDTATLIVKGSPLDEICTAVQRCLDFRPAA
jgi:CheY-like chemotaxis protein